MFSTAASLASSVALPSPVIRQASDGKWLHQPGADANAVLSLHTQQGRRVRQALRPEMALVDLPAGGYLLRIQLPDGTVHVQSVVLP